MSWQKFEERVRMIASFRWNCTAAATDFAGVKCDCILKPSAEEWIAIEITENNTLEKVRADILKLQNIRYACIQQSVVCRCYIVINGNPSGAMRETGRASNVRVLSVNEFQNEWFDYSSYIFMRRKKPFGSLLNQDGQPEENKYIDVTYTSAISGRAYRIADIISALKKGKRIVLKGDFGLGKSRCIKEVFDRLTSSPDSSPYTLAINLREHWGAIWAKELLMRHFHDLGLNEDNYLKIFDQLDTIYLLDGFDEIVTQAWTSDINIMRQIREKSVCAVKDLVQKVKGGVLIAGREYYFNSDEELLKCFGLSEKNAEILVCPSGFSDEELQQFIADNINDERFSEERMLPDWFPRRPLVIQLLMQCAREGIQVEFNTEDIYHFWSSFIDRICAREATIYPALNQDVIKNILVWLSNKTRMQASNTGPITQADLSDAFFAVKGTRPTDESAAMLQRLPSLGRISYDSPDRQFLDGFILNGLRAESIIQLAEANEKNSALFDEKWIHPLDRSGLWILDGYIEADESHEKTLIGIAKRSANRINRVLPSDIVCSISTCDTDEIDYKGVTISEGHFSDLDFSDKNIKNLTIDQSMIEEMYFYHSSMDGSVALFNCAIGTVFGVAKMESLPEQLKNCSVDKFEALSTTQRIKSSNLSEPEKIFVEFLRKLFNQKGAGRKETALIRGMGESVNKKLSETILRKMITEGLISTSPGKECTLYHPNRNQGARVKKILEDLTLSKDPLWIYVSNLK